MKCEVFEKQQLPPNSEGCHVSAATLTKLPAVIRETTFPEIDNHAMRKSTACAKNAKWCKMHSRMVKFFAANSQQVGSSEHQHHSSPGKEGCERRLQLTVAMHHQGFPPLPSKQYSYSKKIQDMHSIYLVFAECRHSLLDSRAFSCPHSVACAVFGHAQIPENPIAAKTPKGRMSIAQRKAFKASQVEMVKKNHGRQGSKKHLIRPSREMSTELHKNCWNIIAL